jgi:opacity protein-like surface antigen
MPLSSDGRWIVDVMVQGSYDITTAEGADLLAVVDNSNGGIIGASATAMRETEESFGYGLGAGLGYEIWDGIGVRAGVEYSSQEANPVVVRDGVNPSHIEFDRETVVTATITATFKFGD